MPKRSRKPEDYKMPKGYFAGTARRRGKSVIHEEVKVKLNVTVTPTAKQAIFNRAKLEGISVSELIETWGRTLLVKTEEKDSSTEEI